MPYWLDLPRPHFPRLEQNRTVDAVIIGTGICGLKMAHYLHAHGVKTIILEGSQVGDGASSRNQGSINHGGGATYAECIRRYSRDQAQAIWQLGLENHRLLQTQLDQF